MVNFNNYNIHIVDIHPRPEWTKLSEADRKQWLHNKLATVNEFLQPDKSEGVWATLAVGADRVIMVFTTMPDTDRDKMRDILRNAETSRYFVYEVITGGLAQNQDAVFTPLLDLPHE